MSTNWDQLVENHFAARKQKPLFEVLSKLINEVVEETLDSGLTEGLHEVRGTEATAGRQKQFTITLPMIRLSEKEWGTEGTKDREIITNLLSRIVGGGSTLTEKIKLLNEYLDAPVKEDATTADIMTAIVFLDTLTNIMIHFNASAAGFTFEGFLAAMLAGEQVPAGTAGIQDIIDNEKNPISLKLLTDKGSGFVKGSYLDLIGHFTDESKASPYIIDPETGAEVENPNYLAGSGVTGSMKYLIGLKSWRESDANKMGELDGTISFYEFVFTARTFLESLFSFEKNKKLLLLPADLGQADQNVRSGEFYDPLGYKEGGEAFGNLYTAAQRKMYADLVDNMTAEAAQEHWEGYFEVREHPKKAGKYHIVSLETGEEVRTLGLPGKAKRGADPRFRKSSEYAREGTLSYGQSVKLLQAALAESDKKFWDLVKETDGAGAGPETQFIIAPKYWKKDYEDGVGFLGQVKVGRAAITELAEKYADKLSQRIFDIYEMLENLSLELNGYFVGGDKDAGLKAAQTADKIESGTREYIEKEKESELG